MNIMNKTVSEYTKRYLEEAAQICGMVDQLQVDAMVNILADVRATGGRIFFLGVGGSAGNCGHAVNDFRKIAGIESYAPTDNVSELTARTNDDGWETVFASYLKVSKIGPKDVAFVFSVGGGNREKNISANIVNALEVTKAAGARVVGVVGRDGGYTKQVADACVVIPTLPPETLTPPQEAFQAVIWHMIVSHPDLKKNEMKWESTK
jgi:D-sedoheptulose 7-phosphate isomerase